MKSLLLAAAFAALALPVAAQDPPDFGSVRITRQAPQTIELPAKYSRIWAGEFDNLTGAYDLSNGDTMAMTKRMNRKYIQVGDRQKVEVIAAGDYDFVSLDEKYRVVLSEPVHGEVTGYVLMKVPSQSSELSQTAIEVQSFRFAAR
jgi:hypothetical protein